MKTRYGIMTAALLVVAACSGTDAPEPIDRSMAPALDDPEGLRLPPVVERKLDNGLRLLIVEHHELPLVDFVMLTGAGPEADPAGKAGLATLVASMLDEGTSTRSALEISDQAAFLGASLGTSGAPEAARVSLHTTTAQLDSALALFADVVQNPSFPQNEFDRLRNERQTLLLQLRDNGPAIADLAFVRTVFGAEHPYGHPSPGTEASVASFTRDDVEQFYRTHYVPNRSTLIVVGDVRPADVERKAREIFGGWAQGTPAVQSVPAAPVRTAREIYLVDKPGAPQSSVRIGHVGVARTSPDYFPLLVLNTILGDAFTSRLNMNLRETRGYTYGAFSQFDMRRSPGPFVAQAEVVAAKTDSAVLEFIKELEGIRQPVPDEELNKAKRYLQLQLPGAFETTSDIARQLVPVALFGLPLDYYDSYIESIAAVTAADVQRVAERYINPDKAAILIVGDRRGIEQELRKLNLGSVSVSAISGAPVR